MKPIVIDLDLIPADLLEKWLYDNSAYISFDSTTNNTIEVTHLIEENTPEYDSIKQQITEAQPTSYTVTELLKKIDRPNFKKSEFKEFLSFKNNSKDPLKNDISVEIKSKFNNEGAYSFTFPLFESIMEKYNAGIDNTIFNFYELKASNGPTIAFEVTDSEGLMFPTPPPVYDLSQEFP